MAEGARLESVYTFTRIVGSNPTPSANYLFLKDNFRILDTEFEFSPQLRDEFKHRIWRRVQETDLVPQILLK